jgi:DNA-binding Xre family transcriptional regulator
MAKSMKDLMGLIRKDARASGPRAVRELRAFESYAKGAAHDLGQLLAQKRISQRELGRRARIAQSEVSKILAGKTDPRIATVEKLAHALGAEVRIVRTASARRVRTRPPTKAR